MRPLLPSAVVLLLLALAGCSMPGVADGEGTQVSDGYGQLTELEGRWDLSTSSWSDCPGDLRRLLPAGPITWRVNGDSVRVEGPAGAGGALELRIEGPNLLGGETAVERLGCTVTETLALTVEAQGEGWSAGTYRAHVAHDGSPACRALVAQAALPDACDTTADWRAWRLAGQ